MIAQCKQWQRGAIATYECSIYRLNEYKDYRLKTGNYKYKYFINKVNMVLPFILGAAALGAGLFGAKKGVDAASAHSKAKNLQREAQEVYKRAELQLNSSRQVTTETLEHLGQLKLEVWDEQLGRFVKLYEQLKNVELTGQANTSEFNAANFTRDELAQMKDIALKAHEVVLGGASAVGAGALAGIASYGGAVMFASASTGTAISTLAGAAATNATLAWFGGGSLVAGGWGMAGGMFALGGIVAGPIFAVGGMLMAAKATENLAKARTYKAEFEHLFEANFQARCVEFDACFTAIDAGLISNKPELTTLALANFAELFGKKLQFENFKEFDDFMINSDQPLIL